MRMLRGDCQNWSLACNKHHDHEMRNWQDEIVRFRCALVRERQDAIRALNPAWRCDDVSFTVTQVSFADFPEREQAALSAIPTRLKLPAETIDQLIAAGTCAVKANPAIGKFAAHRWR